MSSASSALESTLSEFLAAAPAPKPKQRIPMNAVTHGVTGHNLFFGDDEFPAYLQLGADYVEELRPVGARETQIAQKIIDHNWRLNRVAAIENNTLNTLLLKSIVPARTADTKLEGMVAQAEGFRHDCQSANTFEKLGRYEARLSATILKMTAELERLQARRLKHHEDAFVLAESTAWTWYHNTLLAYRKIKAAKSEASKQDPFGKKEFGIAAGGSMDHAPQARSTSELAEEQPRKRPAGRRFT